MNDLNQNRSSRLLGSGLSWLESATWGGLGFLIGMTVGGFLVSFFTGIILAILSAAAGEDLAARPEGQLFRLAFVVGGMLLVGILGVLISFSNRAQANAARVQAAQQAQVVAQRRKDDPEAETTMEAASQPPVANGLTANILDSIRYTGFLFSDTIRLLLPSPVVSTKRSDTTYISDMSDTFKDMMKRVKVTEAQRDIILKNWLPQIEWTNSRANRERDANEMISWWQIILTALIPFIATVDNVFGLRSATVVAVLGIFVTILTGLIRFRRPEERWKHYRRLTEDYQRELWNYISLSGPYKDQEHQAIFKDFNDKMTVMRENDIRVFLGEVTNNVPVITPAPSSASSAGGESQVAVVPPGAASTLAPDQ